LSDDRMIDAPSKQHPRLRPAAIDTRYRSILTYEAIQLS
jgi:hypothetical protein